MFRFKLNAFYYFILIAASSCIKVQTKSTSTTPTVINSVNVTFTTSSLTSTTVGYSGFSHNSKNIEESGTIEESPKVNSNAKDIHTGHDHNSLKADESAQTKNNEVNTVNSTKDVAKRANLNTSKADHEDFNTPNVLRSPNKSGSNRELCPSFNNGAEISLDELSGVWMTVFYRAAQFVECFRIHIRKTSFQEKLNNREFYGSFNKSVDWHTCHLEITGGAAANALIQKRHFLQGGIGDEGVLRNIIIIKNKGHLKLQEEAPAQWRVVNSLLIMRACDNGDVIIFNRIGKPPALDEIHVAMKVFGKTLDGKLACERDIKNLSENETGGKSINETETGGKRLNEEETGVKSLGENETSGESLNENETGVKSLKENETGGKRPNENQTDRKSLNESETGGKRLNEKETGVKSIGESETDGERLIEKETGVESFGESETDGKRLIEKETGVESFGESETGGESINENETDGNSDTPQDDNMGLTIDDDINSKTSVYEEQTF